MITQGVMLSTIFLLVLSGNRIFQKSKEKRYLHSKIFALGLFLIALGIFLYVIRDIFVQFGAFEVQEKLLILGASLQSMGGLLIFWFLVKEFIPGFFKYIAYFLFVIWMVGFMMFSQKIIPMGSEIQRAPLEPLPYFVVRNYPETFQGNIFLGSSLAFLSFLILGTIFYESLKIKEKEARTKGMIFGLGVWFLIAPMIVCVLISPIYARIGYLIGAILIYKTFGREK